jgi:hypothetical protein
MGLTGPEKDRSFKYNEVRFEGFFFIIWNKYRGIEGGQGVFL